MVSVLVISFLCFVFCVVFGLQFISCSILKVLSSCVLLALHFFQVPQSIIEAYSCYGYGCSCTHLIIQSGHRTTMLIPNDTGMANSRDFGSQRNLHEKGGTSEQNKHGAAPLLASSSYEQLQCVICFAQKNVTDNRNTLRRQDQHGLFILQHICGNNESIFFLVLLSLATAGLGLDLCSLRNTGLKYATCLILMIANQEDSEPVRHIKIMSANPSHYWTMWADNRF